MKITQSRMPMTTAAKPKAVAFRQTLDRARAALFAATDSEEWVRAAHRLMLATVPGAFASAALRCTDCDPAYFTSTSGARFQAAEFTGVMATHPGIPYLMNHPGTKVLPTRTVLPPQELLEKTLFYQDFMVPTGWRHAVGLCFWKKGVPAPLDCVLSVHRTADAGDFTDEEIARLGALHDEIDLARRRVTSMEDGRAALSSFQHFIYNLSLPVALLGWDLQPLYHNPLARECCAIWRRGESARQQKVGRKAFDCPAELLAACQEMQGEWRERIRFDSQAESVIVRTVGQTGVGNMRATVRLLFLTGSTLGDPNFMVEFEQPRSKVGHKTPSLAALHGLTPAERIVAAHAAALKSNAEIATDIGRSIGTVKAELHAAYKKLGVRSRAEFVSLLRG